MSAWKETQDEIPLVDFEGEVDREPVSNIATTTIAVEGMTCGACTSALEGTSGFLPEVGVEC